MLALVVTMLYGNNVVRTPNLDRLASGGLVFDRFHVANPICMPNRCSIMTGRIPTAHGCIFNDRSLDWNANTFVRQFAKSKYQTGLEGKSHIQHGPSRDSVVAIEKDLATTDNLPPYCVIGRQKYVIKCI
jgi:arylsulfatase A-like enzyme